MFMWADTAWMWVAMLIFWSFVAVLAFYAVRAWARPASARPGTGAARLLDERYARGEISVEEYRERRHTLEQTAARERER